MSTNANNKRNNGSKKNQANKIRSIILVVGAIILIPLLCLYAYVAFYYHSHFYSKTVINGISTANMTVSEAEDAINSEVKDYIFTLDERDGLTDTITGEEINLHTIFGEGITKLIEKQNNLAWPVAMFQPKVLEINTMIEYDEALLEKCYDQLKCFDKAVDVTPTDATISEYGEKGYEIIPENPGAKIIKDKVYIAVRDAINSLEPSISVEAIGGYEEPKITSDNPELLKALGEMNKLAGAKITYDFGNDSEVLDGTKISKWITVDDNFVVNFDPSGIKDFVDYIGKTYNSFGRIRTFKTSYGKTIKVEGGDYGWWLNRPQEVIDLTQLVQNGEKVKREPVYFQTAQKYGKDDIGDTYVEVNLTAQHLFFYNKGKLILESDFVSGNVSKKLGTPTGTYPVQYKDNDATLVGEDYETPVKYWMPFNKNIGFHDAYWRNEFGKDIYLTNGSHGCINMPPAKAKKMFKYIQRGVAVVVYELPGTESYEIKDSTDKTTAKGDKTIDATKTTNSDHVTNETNTSGSKTNGTNTNGTNTNGTNKSPVQ